MNLTSEQQRAARACGVTFVPATGAQVQRLTMQRRIFRIDDQPFLAVRNDGFWETYGTLMRLIEEYEQDRRQRSVEVPVAPPEAALAPLSAPTLPRPAAKVADPVTAEPAQHQEVARVKPRRRRAVRAGAEAEQEATRTEVSNETPGPTDAASPEELPLTFGIEAVTISNIADGKPVRAVRRLRIRQLQPPRWTTAGKARRGRLK
ncbi:hypothetical protein [Falsiroseomonas sp. E2-1-a20]|uniref:hypothetical protein n=1 Tax=Falsiroseomonas sp. E2-1-a20 TaxID=3239300 RepID=UPI003F2EC2DA